MTSESIRAKLQLKPHPNRCCVDNCPALGKKVVCADTTKHFCRWHRAEYRLLMQIHEVHHKCTSCCSGCYWDQNGDVTNPPYPFLSADLQTRMNSLYSTHDACGYENLRKKPCALLHASGSVFMYTSRNHIQFCTQCHGLS